MNSSTDSNGLGTNSTTSLHEIGGIAYLLIYASEVIPYTVINLLAVLVGVLGKISIYYSTTPFNIYVTVKLN
jgi:hypothetical protein